MPELPEVEICARQLSARLRGRTIRRVEAHDRKLRLPPDLADHKITEVRRRGKFISLHLDDGRRVLIHLGMTGWFEFAPPLRYRLAIATDDGIAYFEDPRRFGKVRVVSATQEAAILAKLGPEPLSRGFDLACLKRTRRPVKVALLDQRLIAGIGNMYAVEALWRAGIHPRRPANRLNGDELRRLKSSIIRVLQKAIAYGPEIYEVQTFQVYDRKGKPCPRCRTPIERIVLGGRGTYFCPGCQRC
jgi:formamidopyrimidine-DNA glycosylase